MFENVQVIQINYQEKRGNLDGCSSHSFFNKFMIQYKLPIHVTHSLCNAFGLKEMIV